MAPRDPVQRAVYASLTTYTTLTEEEVAQRASISVEEAHAALIALEKVDLVVRSSQDNERWLKR